MPSLKLEISIKLIAAILAAMALTALVTYFATTRLSNPLERDLMQEFKATPSATSTPNQQDSATDLESVDVLLVSLKQRLEAQPDDVDGWVLLSKSYYHLNRREEAEAAFEKAKALGYRGSWQPLPRIDSFSQNSSSAINFKDYKTNQDSAQTATQAVEGLQLKILLNSTLRKELPPDAAVFVFVRAAENPGPPLAVVRTKVDELPFEIVLNDSHAMIPGKNISSVSNVIVGTRISMSGNPGRQPGDYEQLSDPIPSNFNKTVELVIADKI
jgi:tetratricopeptide (TPR) repeat protein